MNHRNWILAILLTAAAIIYAVLWPEAPSKAFYDSYEYVWTAHALQSGNLTRPLDRPPGFPLLLLLTGSGRNLYLFHILSHVVSISLLLLLMNSLEISYRRKIIFTLIALSPGIVSVLCGYVMSEALCELFLVTSFVLFAFWFRSKKISFLILGGIILSLSALVRPAYVMLFVPVAALIFFAVDRKKLQSALVVFVLGAMIIGSYVGFNGVRFGYYGITPLFGYNLCTRTVRVLERLPEGPIKDILISYRNDGLVNGDSHTAVIYIWKLYSADLFWPETPEHAKGKGPISELMAATGMNKAELSKVLARANIKLILKAPMEYVRDVGLAAFTFWLPQSTDMAQFGSRKIQLLYGLIYAGVMVAFFIQLALILASIGLFFVNQQFQKQLSTTMAWYKQNYFYLLLAAIYIFYTFAISITVEVGSPRYRAPIDIFIFFFIGIFSLRQSNKDLVPNTNVQNQ